LSERLPEFEAELWRWKGHASWHFVTLPADLADSVRLHGFLAPRGWGSVRVRAVSGNVGWDTSVFPDKSSGSYILPVKADVRRRLGIGAGDRFPLELTLRNQAMI
jgi:hypothetical protein